MVDVHRSPVHHRSPADGAASDRESILRTEGLSERAHAGREPEIVTVRPEDAHVWRPTEPGGVLRPGGEHPAGGGSERPPGGREPEIVTVRPEDAHVWRPTEPGGVLRHGVEHRLEVGWRAAGDAEGLAGGGLLLPGPGEGAV